MSWKQVFIGGSVLGFLLGASAYTFLSYVESTMVLSEVSSSCGLDSEEMCSTMDSISQGEVAPIATEEPIATEPEPTPEPTEPVTEPSEPVSPDREWRKEELKRTHPAPNGDEPQIVPPRLDGPVNGQ